MMQFVQIEFTVNVPNAAVAGDVETRLSREHYDKLREVLKSITGYDPLLSPDLPGLSIDSEIVTWDDREQDWARSDDEDDDE